MWDLLALLDVHTMVEPELGCFFLLLQFLGWASLYCWMGRAPQLDLLLTGHLLLVRLLLADLAMLFLLST
jgi:hypothetical protein